MAKKKIAKKVTPRKKKEKQQAEHHSERVACMVRLVPEVHEKCRMLAEEAGISFNQLIHGLCKFAAENGRAGYGREEQDGTVTCHPLAGCIWFGQPTIKWSDLHKDDPEWQWYEEGDGEFLNRGQFYFRLDFAERVTRRED